MTSSRWTAREVGVLVATTAAVASISLTQTLSIPLLPILNRRFGDVANVSWVATATLVASAITSPIVGRMGDIFGKRVMTFICLGGTLGAALAGVFVDSLPALIVVRFVQGVGAGVIPLAFGILRDELGPARLVTATSVVMVGGAGVGAGLGPIVAGVVLDHHGVDGGFWFSAAAVALALILTAVWTSPSGIRFPAAFDPVGTIGLGVVLVSTMLGLTKAPQWGWSSPLTLVLLGGGALAAVLWFRWERTVAEPAVDVAVSTSGPVLVAHLGGIVAGFATFAQYIVIVALVSLPASTGHGLGRSVAFAGLVQLPGVIVLSLTVLLAARLVKRWGAHAVVGVGSAVLALGFGLGVVRHGSVGDLVVSVIVANIGLGPLFCALPILILETVDISVTSTVNAVNSLARQIGSVLASAAAGSIMATSSVVVAGIAYPAEWTFVAVYAIAASGAATFAVLTVAIRRRRAAAHAVAPLAEQVPGS